MSAKIVIGKSNKNAGFANIAAKIVIIVNIARLYHINTNKKSPHSGGLILHVKQLRLVLNNEAEART